MSMSLSRREVLERELLARPVASLQYMLRQLSRVEPALPELMVDGVFGPRTQQAVMAYQRLLGLPATGEVGQELWNAIRDGWLALEVRNSETRPLRAFPSEGVQVVQGERREYMRLPQTMFQILSRQLEGIVPAPADGVHGPASAANVRWLQKAAGLPETGRMDQATWDALSRLYEIFVVRDTGRLPAFTGGWG